MRTMLLVTLGCLMLVLSGCGPKKPKDLIVGKWEPADERAKGAMMIEFTSDGKTNTSMMGMTVPATYTFIDDDTFEQETKLPGMPEGIKQKTKVKITGDEMEMTDDKGKALKMKRVK